jgi:hypothetical protein
MDHLMFVSFTHLNFSCLLLVLYMCGTSQVGQLV